MACLRAIEESSEESTKIPGTPTTNRAWHGVDVGSKVLRRVLADLEVFEQGLEGLRPLQAFALRKVHSSEVSGRRRVRENLPKLGERAGNRRRFAENLFFVCAGFSLDNVQRRRAPRRRNRTEEPMSGCPQTKE